MFDQLLDLLGQPPGSLVYHFIILFAVEAALAISIGQWMRERDDTTVRLTVAALGIFIARAVLLVASMLAWQGYLPRNVLLPPVERAVDSATILALAWAFTTMDDPAILNRNFMPDLISAVLGGTLVAGFVGTYYYWFFSASSGQLFNGLWLDLAWAGAQIAVAVGGLVLMLSRIRFVYDAFLKGIMLLALAGAAALHLVRPELGDVAVAMRVGQLLVMPMLSAVAFRHVVEQLMHWDEFEPSRNLPPIAQPIAQPIGPPISLAMPLEVEPESPPVIDFEPLIPSPPSPPPAASLEETVKPAKPEPEPAPIAPTPRTHAELLEIIDAVGQLLGTLEQSEIVHAAPRAVAEALRADIAVLVIVDENEQRAGVVGGYDNIAQTELPSALLDLAEHPSIVNALGRLRQIRATPARNTRELRDLYSALLIVNDGPAYYQPLVSQEERIGVIVVGSPYSERALSNDERDLLDRLSPLVTAALLNVETYQRLQEEAQEITAEESVRMVHLADDLTAKVSELNEARRQMDEMKQYIRDLHRQLDSVPDQQDVQQEQVETLLAEIERLREALKQTEETGQDSEAVRIRLQEAEAEIAALRTDKEQLLQKALEAEQRAAARPAESPTQARLAEIDYQAWEESRLNAQREIASLRAKLMEATISQIEVEYLQEELARKSRDVIGLQTRLTESEAVAAVLREQVTGTGVSAHNLEIMQQRVEAQAAEIATLESKLSEAESQRIDAEALADQAEMNEADREAMALLQSQLAERAELVEALEARLSEKNQAISELRTYMSEVEASLQHLEQQLSAKADETLQLQRSLAETREQAQQRIAELEAGLEAADQSEADRARLEALQAELAEKSTAIEVLEDQLRNTTESMAGLEEQLAASRTAVDAAIVEAQRIDTHDEVIASIAQELRTPMSSIIGYTDLLLRESVGILGSLQRKFLQRVKANTERMGSLLDDLIRITALDTGRMTLQPESIEVAPTVEEAVMNVANQYQEKGLTLHLDIRDNIPPLTADRDAMLQMIGHLLANAALASPVEGDVQLGIAARRGRVPTDDDGQEAEAECLYITVRDSGSGVHPDDYERVFARKYRADNPLIEGLGDTGVSLSLAKTLIDAHGGRIWLASEESGGTTFHVLVPFEPQLDGNGAA